MKNEKFLKTGEFARLCHTTKETLFHYDREGILKPRHVSGNGYRRYGLEQFFDFDMISLLKETGSTLGEIRACREMRDPRAYLRLLRERAGILKKERARLARREAMLRRLIALTEETIGADFDRLLLEEKEAERIIAVPTDPEKILSGAGSVECYSACLAHDLERGNSTDAPLGMIIPAEHAGKGEFRPGFFFTRAEAGDAGDVREIPAGRYAAFFHKGEVSSQAAAFGRMVRAVADSGLRMRGDAYGYDLMSHLLTGSGAVYVAKYIVRLE